jgi:hypothetical protein
MTAGPDLPAIVGAASLSGALRPRTDLGQPGWVFWELRTLNRHRVVGLVTPYRQFVDACDLEAEIRRVVSHNFKRSWWRGMAYGVVADVGTISLGVEDLKMLVDIRENSRGTLQWVILVAGRARAALGVHTWMEGYLSTVYRGTLQALGATGYAVASARRDKDGMMKVLTGVADLNAALGSLGARTEAFPEFRD